MFLSGLEASEQFAGEISLKTLVPTNRSTFGAAAEISQHFDEKP